jgi:hypothetical protein
MASPPHHLDNGNHGAVLHALSESVNTVALRSCEYSGLMPRVPLGTIEIGLSLSLSGC